MKSPGRKLGDQQQVEAPVSRSLVSAVTPWALMRTRLRIARPTGIRQARAQRVFQPLAQAEEEAGAQGEEEDVAGLDDQRLGAVGAGLQLAPEDRVGPGLAIGPGGGRHAAMRPAGDVQPGRRAGRLVEWSVAAPGSGDGRGAIEPIRRPSAASPPHRRRGADGDRRHGGLFLDLDQRLDHLGLGLVAQFAGLVMPGIPFAQHERAERHDDGGERQPDADVDEARRPHHAGDLVRRRI